jgi:hypothetical protein
LDTGKLHTRYALSQFEKGPKWWTMNDSPRLPTCSTRRYRIALLFAGFSTRTNYSYLGNDVKYLTCITLELRCMG